jgi:hypothetical protein
MAVKCTNTFYCKTLQNYPNWKFWFENILSGNPAKKLRNHQTHLEQNACFWSTMERTVASCVFPDWSISQNKKTKTKINKNEWTDAFGGELWLRECSPSNRICVGTILFFFKVIQFETFRLSIKNVKLL